MGLPAASSRLPLFCASTMLHPKFCRRRAEFKVKAALRQSSQPAAAGPSPRTTGARDKPGPQRGPQAQAKDSRSPPSQAHQPPNQL